MWVWDGGRGAEWGGERAPFLLAGSELGQAGDDGCGPLWPPAGLGGVISGVEGMQNTQHWPE